MKIHELKPTRSAAAFTWCGVDPSRRGVRVAMGTSVATCADCARAKAQTCSWEIRRARGDRFEFVACGRRATTSESGHPRCSAHSEKGRLKSREKSHARHWSKTMLPDAVDRLRDDGML